MIVGLIQIILILLVVFGAILLVRSKLPMRLKLIILALPFLATLFFIAFMVMRLH